MLIPKVLAVLLAATVLSVSYPETASAAPAGSSSKIRHIIIIFQENRSMDNMFNGFPGADTTRTAVDSHGRRVALTPAPLDVPYDIDHTHRSFVTEYDGGRMDGFDKADTWCATTCEPNPHRALTYVQRRDVEPYWSMARRFTLADRMFQTNQGPTTPAHMYIISGTSAAAPENPTDFVAENPSTPIPSNNVGCDAPKGSTVMLLAPNGSEANPVFPCFDQPTLMDELSARSITWKYYAQMGGYLFNGPDLIKHIRYGPLWQDVVTPQTTVLNDIAANQLPAVSWVMPDGRTSDHATSNDGSGPSWVSAIVNAVGTSPYWNDTAIFITWDDWGGFYDHVVPHMYNQYELGFRVPLIVVSPYAKRGYVSHVQHEFGSILKFTEETFDLPSLGTTDVRSDDLSDCFDFAQNPIAFEPIEAPLSAAYFLSQPPSDIPADTE